VLQKANRFLEAFGDDIELVRPHLREVDLCAGQVLAEPGEAVRRIYFLHGGVVSKLTVFEDGTEIECAIVGREGAVGAMAAIGLQASVTRDVCHLPVRALTLEPAILIDAMRRSERIHTAIDRYCALKISYAIRNGACNARHTVEHRLCRWLLTCSDVLEESAIHLPQEIFAKMLGVQRTSVNPILQRLRAEGLIGLSRSRLTLLDRPRLSQRACECYRAMRRTEAEVLAPLLPAPAVQQPRRAG
jgi:CRP-like cAMP-binding protein